MNRHLLLLVLVLPAFALTGCLVQQQAYFASPFNGAANDYHPLPQIKDSVRTACYIQGAYISTSTNNEYRDEVNAFRGSFTVAHHDNLFQVYGGGNLTLGSYKMGEWQDDLFGNSPG